MPHLRLWRNLSQALFPLLLATCTACSYTPAEDLAQKRLDEGVYAVYWKNKESGFQCQMKGIFDYETAVDLAEQKKSQRPENEYWVEKVR